MKTLAQMLIVWLMLWCVGLGLACWTVGCPFHSWCWAALWLLALPGYPLWSEAGTDAAPARRQPPPESPPLGARIPVRTPPNQGGHTATVTTGTVTQTVPVTFTPPPPQEVS